MSGAGSFPAGSAPAGTDLPITTPTTAIAKPKVTYFDPGLMTLPMEPDGSVRAVHPVDAQVILALSIPQGTIASVPTQGHTLNQLGRMQPSQLPAAATDRVKLALAGPLSRGDIDLLGVTVDAQPYGSLHVSVSYQNLRLPTSLPRTLSIAQ